MILEECLGTCEVRNKINGIYSQQNHFSKINFIIEFKRKRKLQLCVGKLLTKEIKKKATITNRNFTGRALPKHLVEEKTIGSSFFQ